jgi:hypothetical protein
MFTTINVNPIIGFNGKVVNLIATLYDMNKNTLNNKIIEFSINGISLGSVTTNTSGIANLPYTITQATGIYTIFAEFFGDSNYVPNNHINQLEVDNTIPTGSATVPGGLYNTSKTVVINKNEPGTIYYTLNGVKPTTSNTKYTVPLVINTSKLLKYFIVDLAGNQSPTYTVTYTIDKVAPKVSSSSPVNLQRGVTRGGTLVIRFNEKIKASIYWNKITIKNLRTNKYVSITKMIKDNTLYIKTSQTRRGNSWYQISIPRYAIRDYAGNKLWVPYTFRFKTY